MSTQYQREIFNGNGIKLYANYTGISGDDQTSAEDLCLNFFAFDKSTGKLIFSETLSCDELKTLYRHLDQIPFLKDSRTEDSCTFTEVTPELAEFLSILNSEGDKLKKFLDKINKD